MRLHSWMGDSDLMLHTPLDRACDTVGADSRIKDVKKA